MSDTDASTMYAATMPERFRANPTDHTVELHDGTLMRVAGFIDTPRGRWLRLRTMNGRFGPWVPEHDVVALHWHTVGLTDYALSLGGTR